MRVGFISLKILYEQFRFSNEYSLQKTLHINCKKLDVEDTVAAAPIHRALCRKNSYSHHSYWNEKYEINGWIKDKTDLKIGKQSIKDW